jgi:hypothetical protein
MKKIINIALIAAAMTGAAVSAQAADTDINLYGASAQRDYWNALAPEFLTDTMGCTSVQKAQVDSNYVIHKGTACTATGGDVYINYSSVASMEGVLAAIEQAPLDATLNDTCSGNNALREIASKASCNFGTGVCTAKVCADITGGTSDVEMSSFNQVSTGNVNGHKGGGVKTFTAIGTGYDVTTNMVDYKPTIVPFAFYANNDLGGTQPDGDQGNLNRTQAVNLFAGKIATWDMLKGYEAYGDEVQVCLRHAGSGTHATLDKVVFRDDTKSNIDPATGKPYLSLVTAENTASAPYIYFYQSSSKALPAAGMKECVETNGGNGRFSGVIAVGYMDADTLSNANMHQMKYQGTPAVDEENKAAGLSNDYINKGSYDFWSAQNVYVKTADNSAAVQSLMAFAETKIPSTKVGIWTSKSNLQVLKAADTHLPMNQ